MGKVYYNQADSRWANYPYTSPTHPQATVKTSGCGPTSGAMVIASLVKTEVVYPNAIAQMFKDNGFRANEGTSLSAFPWLANVYDLECHETYDLNDAVNCLNRDGMAICSCEGGGLFSTGGHIIVLAGMKDSNTIIVYDPYLYDGKFNTSGRKGKVTVNGNEVYCSMYNFKTYARCRAYYCYEKPEEPIPDLQYQAHIEDIGWTEWQDAGTVEGTEGQGKRIEAVKFKANNDLQISYRAHCQNIGWTDWKNSGEVAGTTGQSLRLEAIEMRANKLLEAQEHIEQVGWMPVSTGTEIHLGTVGKALRLEAFRIIVK